MRHDWSVWVMGFVVEDFCWRGKHPLYLSRFGDSEVLHVSQGCSFDSLLRYVQPIYLSSDLYRVTYA